MSLVGVVKSAESEGFIAFAPSDPEDWVSIPHAHDAKAERVGTCPCPGESRSVVRLTLKGAETDTERVLQSLLAQPARSTSFAASPSAGAAPLIVRSFAAPAYAYPTTGGGRPQAVMQALPTVANPIASIGGRFDRTIPVCGTVTYPCGRPM